MEEAQIPLALRQLIQLHNEKVREYQQIAMLEIQRASLELMQLLNLSPNDGWKLDVENMKFVKVPTEQITDGTP
jgi:hypothetical protein